MLPVLTVATTASAAPAADGPWQKIDGAPAPETPAGEEAAIAAKRLAAYKLDRDDLASLLEQAPLEPAPAARQRTFARQQSLVISLPAPDGSFERFELFESPVMEAGLAAAHPEISTYAGKGLDDPTATIRADLTPLGFHASIRSAEGSWYIDPFYERDQSVYASYFASDLENRNGDFVEREDVETAAHALEHDIHEAARRRARRRSAGDAAHLPARLRHRPVVRELLRRGERDRGEGDADQPGQPDLRGRDRHPARPRSTTPRRRT